MESALISATVAAIIFAVTEWLKGARARHDFIRGKLQELCEATVTMRAAVLKMADAEPVGTFESQMKLLAEISEEILNASTRLQMLQAIYFPTLRDHRMRIATAAGFSYVRRIHNHPDKGGDYKAEVVVNPAQLRKLIADCDQFLDYVSQSAAEISEEPFFDRWYRGCSR